MKILASICVMFFVLTGSALSASYPSQMHADAAYLEMVRQARIMPKNFDFVALRRTYIETSFYSPAGAEVYKVDLFKAFDKVRAGDPAGEREMNALLDKHFAHYAIHLYLRDAAAADNPIRVDGIDSTLHVWALAGILPTILYNQVGLIPEKAIHVIDQSEEDFVAMWHFKAEVSGRKRIERDGHVYDVLTMKRNGHKADIHFNIDIPLSREEGFHQASRQ